MRYCASPINGLKLFCRTAISLNTWQIENFSIGNTSQHKRQHRNDEHTRRYLTDGKIVYTGFKRHKLKYSNRINSEKRTRQSFDSPPWKERATTLHRPLTYRTIAKPACEMASMMVCGLPTRWREALAWRGNVTK